MQDGGLQAVVASDEEEAEEGLSDSASSAEEDIDEMGNDSDAVSSGSEEEEEDEGAAGMDRNPAAAKKQKIGVETNGLGSVGWDASDVEEDAVVPADAGKHPPPSPSLFHPTEDIEHPVVPC